MNDKILSSYSIALDILNFVTPISLKKLTSSGGNKKKISLTDLILKEDFGVDLALNPAEVVNPDAILEMNNDQQMNATFVKERVSDDQDITEKSASLHLLDERKKMEHGQFILKKKQILSLYAKTHSVNIQQNKISKSTKNYNNVEEEEDNELSEFGTLLDKKQF